MATKLGLNDVERGISGPCDETARLRDRCAALENAAADVSYAAARQLAGMGKGREPSERLAEALAAVADLLGRDPTTEARRPAGRDAR